MIKILKSTIFLLLISLVTISCKKEDGVQETHPNIQVNLNGERQSQVVDMPFDNWEAYGQTNDLWCTFNKVEGENKISINVEGNDTGEERTTYIIVQTGSELQKINVYQDLGRYISFESQNIIFRGRADTQNVAIESNFSTDFSAQVVSEGTDWLTLNIEDNTLKLNAAQNPSESEEREAQVEVSGIVASTGEVVTVALYISQKPFGGIDYYFNIPDFSESKVYKVMGGGRQIAQICKEYLSDANTKVQAVVVYPVTTNGTVKLDEGYVAQVLLTVDNTGMSITTGEVHGGKVIFDRETNSITEYTPGLEVEPVTTVYVPGDDVISGTETAGSQLATVEPDVIVDNRGDESNIYPIVKVGTQYWMGENLRTTKYNHKKNFSDILTNVAETAYGDYWRAKEFKAICRVPGYVDANSEDARETKEQLGVLYTFLAINGADSVEEANISSTEVGNVEDNISPQGWIVPTRDDLDKIYTYIGLGQVHTRKIRAYVDNGGNPENISEKDDENITGFSAINAGYVKAGGALTAGSAYFWTRTYTPKAGTANQGAWSLNMSGRYENEFMRAFQIRSIKAE